MVQPQLLELKQILQPELHNDTAFHGIHWKAFEYNNSCRWLEENVESNKHFKRRKRKLKFQTGTFPRSYRATLLPPGENPFRIGESSFNADRCSIHLIDFESFQTWGNSVSKVFSLQTPKKSFSKEFSFLLHSRGRGWGKSLEGGKS